MNTELQLERFEYDDDVVRKFSIATVVWSLVALLLGLIIALQLAFWQMNLGMSFTTFGRLRPLHTNAAIFAFAGNAIFAGIYYSTQRLCKARLFSDLLSKIHFWGWQLIIVLAAVTLPQGITSGKEYAELEWPIDILITLVWVVFAVNFFGTLFRRRERHMYVALWFYIATVITVAMLHIFNSLAYPLSLTKSYSVYAGVQDALVQWWYGHNAVAFFLTTPFLGLMYYFMPKATGKPVYSYRLSIVHFWSLIFIYIWAGPHHLLYTALPDWAQTLGMIFSVMLWAPSWGGMINGLLTLRGAWGRLREEPILKFFAAGVTFYGMSTFEGPLLSIKSVSSLAHYTDWIIGHVHGGALGWNGFMSYGMLYWLVPKLWKRELHSKVMANTHFWLGTAGILVYMMSMWAAGITQGLMLRGVDDSGHLMYPDFVQTVMRIMPLYYLRAFGGLLYLTGVVLGAINIFKTIALAPKTLSSETVSAPRLAAFGQGDLQGKMHRVLEGIPAVFTVLVLIAVVVGGLVQIVPLISATDYANIQNKQIPYTALQLHGRDIYIREGCYVCHSQMIRPLEGDTARYGAPSKLEDSMYDHPFQWGSRRVGPDLARVGGKYPNLWHYRHMMDPREIVNGSVMPTYSWLERGKIDYASSARKMQIMRKLGIPYTDADIEASEQSARRDAKVIADELKQNGAPAGLEESEITALISYLQRLGKGEPVKVGSNL